MLLQKFLVTVTCVADIPFYRKSERYRITYLNFLILIADQESIFERLIGGLFNRKRLKLRKETHLMRLLVLVSFQT